MARHPGVACDGLLGGTIGQRVEVKARQLRGLGGRRIVVEARRLDCFVLLVILGIKRRRKLRGDNGGREIQLLMLVLLLKLELLFILRM